MYTETFEKLGLAKNEARIYETLLREGELSVSEIASKSAVNRRNVYDSMKRLLEKGLVFEVLEKFENRYQAVQPQNLMELIDEKRQMLSSIMPSLESLFASTPRAQQVFIYRGIEGWKNYLRDILRLGEDFYCIGAKGGWMDERAMTYFPTFIKEAKRKKIKFHHLFDHEVKERKHEILKYVGNEYKFLPKGYSTPSSIDIFGDRVLVVSSIAVGAVDLDVAFTVMVNREVADAFRVWFKFMWDFCPNR